MRPPQFTASTIDKTEERPMEKHHVKLNIGLVANMMKTDLLLQ